MIEFIIGFLFALWMRNKEEKNVKRHRKEQEIKIVCKRESFGYLRPGESKEDLV